MTCKMTLIRAIAALRPEAPASTTASAKMALCALANRWPMLDAEIKEHEAVLEQLARAHAAICAKCSDDGQLEIASSIDQP